jgi:TPR repeat protein
MSERPVRRRLDKGAIVERLLAAHGDGRGPGARPNSGAMERGALDKNALMGRLLGPPVPPQLAGLPASAEALRRKADGGDARSQADLGTLLFTGSAEAGIEAFPAAAVYYLRLAAAQGHVTAAFRLAVCHQAGRGTQQDVGAAARYFMQAADGGDEEAQLRVGEMYEQAEGVRRDPARAANYFRMAMAQGNLVAANNLAELLVAQATDGGGARGLAAETGERNEECWEEARRYFATAAYGGVADAQYNLGQMLLMDGGAADAAVWLAKASAQGHAEAARAMASLFRLGDGVERSDTQAGRYLNMAADAGSCEAQFELGWDCFRGECGAAGRRSLLDAMHWWGVAASGGHEQAVQALQQAPELRALFEEGQGHAAGENVGSGCGQVLREALGATTPRITAAVGVLTGDDGHDHDTSSDGATTPPAPILPSAVPAAAAVPNALTLADVPPSVLEELRVQLGQEVRSGLTTTMSERLHVATRRAATAAAEGAKAEAEARLGAQLRALERALDDERRQAAAALAEQIEAADAQAEQLRNQLRQAADREAAAKQRATFEHTAGEQSAAALNTAKEAAETMAGQRGLALAELEEQLQEERAVRAQLDKRQEAGSVAEASLRESERQLRAEVEKLRSQRDAVEARAQRAYDQVGQLEVALQTVAEESVAREARAREELLTAHAVQLAAERRTTEEVVAAAKAASLNAMRGMVGHPRAEPEPEAQPETGPEPEPKLEQTPVLEPQPRLEPMPELEPIPPSRPEPEPEPEPEPDLDPDLEPELAPELKPESEPADRRNDELAITTGEEAELAAKYLRSGTESDPKPQALDDSMPTVAAAPPKKSGRRRFSVSRLGPLTAADKAKVSEKIATELRELGGVEFEEASKLLVNANAPTRAKSGRRRFSVSGGSGATSATEMNASALAVGSRIFDVTSSTGSKLQLQVGSMGILIFKKRKIFETLMVEKMQSWLHEDNSFFVQLFDGTDRFYVTDPGDSKIIEEELTVTAKLLAAAMQKTTCSEQDQPIDDAIDALALKSLVADIAHSEASDTDEGSVDADALSTLSDGTIAKADSVTAIHSKSPAIAKKKLRRFSVSLSPKQIADREAETAAATASSLLAGHKLFEVQSARGDSSVHVPTSWEKGTLQLQAASLGLQLFRPGKPIENLLYESMAEWGAVESLLLVGLKNGKKIFFRPKTGGVSTGTMEEAAAAMTEMATLLSAAKQPTSKQSRVLTADDVNVGEQLELLCDGLVQTQSSTESATICSFSAGTVITVLEVAKLPRKQGESLWVRCEDGWLSSVANDGTTLLARSTVSKRDIAGENIEPRQTGAGQGAAPDRKRGRRRMSISSSRSKGMEVSSAAISSMGQLWTVRKGDSKTALQLQVGSMGLKLFKDTKVMESVMMASVTGRELTEKGLEIRTQNQGAMAQTLVLATESTAEAEAIAEAMDVLLEELSVAQKVVDKSSVGRALASLGQVVVGDKLRSIAKCALKETSDRTSQKLDTLHIGSVIEVIETCTNDYGQMRVRCSKGWASTTNEKGKLLMEQIDDPARAPEYFAPRIKEATEDVVPGPQDIALDSASLSKISKEAPERKPRRRFSVASNVGRIPDSVALAPNDTLTTMPSFDVTRGGAKLQLKIAGMSIQLIKGGATVVESVLFQHIKSWEHDDTFIDISADRTSAIKTQSVLALKTAEGEAIAAAMAKSAQAMVSAEHDSNTGDTVGKPDAIGVDAPKISEQAMGSQPAPTAKKGGIRRRMSISSSVSKVANSSAETVSGALGMKIFSVKYGRKMQLQVASMGLQIHPGKTDKVVTLLYEKLDSWSVSDTILRVETSGEQQITSADGKSKVFVFTCEDSEADEIAGLMTKQAQQLATEADQRQQVAVGAETHAPHGSVLLDSDASCDDEDEEIRQAAIDAEDSDTAITDDEEEVPTPGTGLVLELMEAEPGPELEPETQLSQAPTASSAKKGVSKRRMSVSRGPPKATAISAQALAATDTELGETQTIFEVYKGTTKMQLQVGSMGLQMIRNGKAMTSVLYEHTLSWEVIDNKLRLQTTNGTNTYGCMTRQEAGAISQLMTSNATALADVKQHAEATASSSLPSSVLSPLESSASAPAKKSRRRFSISSTDRVTSESAMASMAGSLYNVDGRSDLQLQVGSMNIQLFKDGKVVESHLYATMHGWEGKGNDLVLLLSEGKTLNYTVGSTHLRNILDTMTKNATALATARRVAKHKQEEEQKLRDVLGDDSEEQDTDSTPIAARALGSEPANPPAPKPPGSVRRRMSISSGSIARKKEIQQHTGAQMKAMQLLTGGDEQFDAQVMIKRRMTSIQLQVGPMALQSFVGGRPLANVLFQQMLSWHASKDDLVIVLKDDKELVYTTPHAAPVAAAMTKYATALADESAKKLAERSAGDSDLMSDTSEEEEEEQQKEGGEPVDIHLGTIAIEERVFDVYRGTRMFQMQVGSKALQILSAGDVVDSMLFGQLTGWEVTGSNLILTMSDQSEKSFRSDHVAEIAQAIAHKQKSLSGARKSGQNEVFQVSAMSSDDFAPPKKAGKLRRMSISLGLASNSPLESASKLTTASAMGATQLIEYNVKQGSSKLKLQVGSMGLTVTKNGKPHESSILFAKASGWNVEGNTLRVEPVDGGSTLIFTVADEEHAEGIAETMTANAMVLAKAKRQMANSQSAAPAKMEQLKTTGGHVDEDEDLHFDSTSEDDFDSGVSQAPTVELSGVSTVKPRRGSVDKLNRNYAKKLKRVAISARPMSAESANVELLDIPKNKEEITFLRNALRGQSLFQDLDKEQIDQFVGCMAHEKFANGDVLITQGDLGDKLFVLRSGSCNCTIGGKSVKLYEAGQSFGELALLYDCPRAASVTVGLCPSWLCVQLFVCTLGH